MEPASFTSPALAGGFFTASTIWETPKNVWYVYSVKWDVAVYKKDEKALNVLIWKDSSDILNEKNKMQNDIYSTWLFVSKEAQQE